MIIAVPAHITGFFLPVIKSVELEAGSLGAGFSINRYVFTSISIKKAGSNKIQIFFNGKDQTRTAITSELAAKLILEKAEIRNIEITIFHSFQVPIGCGLSSSGAGALGTVFAINEALDLGFSREELAKIAHIAEVKRKTGLGSVIAQYDGMFEIRVREGGPGIGRVVRIPREGEVLIIVWGPIETPTILSSRNYIERIKNAFGVKIGKLLKHPTLIEFARLSFDFAKKSGLINDYLHRILEELGNMGYYGSMLMIGRGIFLVSEDGFSKNDVKKISRKIELGNATYFTIARLDNFGVRIIE
ncbi:MAG: pantoate kinase [Candidatus Njordarchaeales archaeon]